MKRYNNPGNKFHFVFFFNFTKYRITHYCQKVQNTNTYIYRLFKFLTIKGKTVLLFFSNYICLKLKG